MFGTSFFKPALAYGNYFNRAKTHFSREWDAGEDEVDICPTPGCCYVFAPCNEIEMGRHIIGAVLSIIAGGVGHFTGGLLYAIFKDFDSSINGAELAAICFGSGALAFFVTASLYGIGVTCTEAARHLAEKHQPTERCDEENIRHTDPRFKN